MNEIPRPRPLAIAPLVFTRRGMNCHYKIDGATVHFRCQRTAAHDVLFDMPLEDVLTHERHGVKRYVNSKGTIMKCPECMRRATPAAGDYV